MSLRCYRPGWNVGARFVWRTFWRKAREASRDRGRHYTAWRLAPGLERVKAAGGMGPPAVAALCAYVGAYVTRKVHRRYAPGVRPPEPQRTSLERE